MRNLNGIPNSLFTIAASLALRVSGFAALWWVLAEGRIEDLGFVALCLGLALAVSLRLWPPGTAGWRPLGVVRFIPYFLNRSVKGGVDVARRAFNPAMPLQPEILIYELNGSERQSVLLAWIVSLLPGTASVRLDDKTLRIHVLDSRMPIRENLRELERQVAAICD